MTVFNVIRPETDAVPIIISSPHSGTAFPDAVAGQMRPEMVADPDDTDLFIDRLYDFAPAMGITMITANYNRWVIDLNRDPDSEPLYNDGRVITGLVPTTTFNGDYLYDRYVPGKAEIQGRLDTYYWPYHNKLRELINDTHRRFGRALLFDAHSIRKQVPGIRKEPFPDLILGDNDETSAGEDLIAAALKALEQGRFELRHNHPFKGGYITRHYGDPAEHIHALQLEMAKTNYMDDSETDYDEARAEVMRALLKNMFEELINALVA